MLHGALGYFASVLVLATFSMKRMLYLRGTAIASNLAFIAYATQNHLPPILILHGVLLPLNLYRLKGEWTTG
jgi:CRP/FNR family cyclic AMP-dependent transcriptional regulator